MTEVSKIAEDQLRTLQSEDAAILKELNARRARLCRPSSLIGGVSLVGAVAGWVTNEFQNTIVYLLIIGGASTLSLSGEKRAERDGIVLGLRSRLAAVRARQNAIRTDLSNVLKDPAVLDRLGAFYVQAVDFCRSEWNETRLNFQDPLQRRTSPAEYVTMCTFCGQRTRLNLQPGDTRDPRCPSGHTLSLLLTPMAFDHWAKNPSEIIDPSNTRPYLNSREYENKLRQAEKEAWRNLRNHPANGQIGFCHVLWAEQKQILKERYGIEWDPPTEGVLYD